MARALWLRKTETGQMAGIGPITEADLPEGEVLVDVACSTLNYKDALAITGKAPIVRAWPMVPGIDFAGTVRASRHALWQAGDPVILNGWGTGETRLGGLAEIARVPGEWLVPLPEGYALADAMAIGTAGYTAMLAVLRLEAAGLVPSSGPLLVTGAMGGVGSVAILVLAKLGFEVWALTGRPAEAEHLKGLGAAGIVPREELAAPGKPLARERWAGGVDAVGSHVLANLLAATKYGGTVAACGLAAGMDLPMTVAPFILRGVTLAGIDSVYVPIPRRREAWSRLARDLPADRLREISRSITLDEVVAAAVELLAGQVRGRLVVKLAE
ncbi:MAG: MDR family oxidoreductase [Geminicoccaceae bacterium]